MIKWQRTVEQKTELKTTDRGCLLGFEHSLLTACPGQPDNDYL